MAITLTILCWRKDPNSRCKALAYCQDATPPATTVAQAGFQLNGPACDAYFPLAFFVPQGWYYQVTKVEDMTNVVTVFSWVEVEL